MLCVVLDLRIVWCQAYALGAQIVFWPSMMNTPDRDAISLARLFRVHIVCNGKPGEVSGLGVHRPCLVLYGLRL